MYTDNINYPQYLPTNMLKQDYSSYNKIVDVQMKNITYIPEYFDNETARFLIHSDGFLDPYSLKIEFTVEVKTGAECCVDNSAHSFIKELIISSNGIEIERIKNYDILNSVLFDISLGVNERKLLGQGFGDSDVNKFEMGMGEDVWNGGQDGVLNGHNAETGRVKQYTLPLLSFTLGINVIEYKLIPLHLLPNLELIIKFDTENALVNVEKGLVETESETESVKSDLKIFDVSMQQENENLNIQKRAGSKMWESGKSLRGNEAMRQYMQDERNKYDNMNRYDNINKYEDTYIPQNISFFENEYGNADKKIGDLINNFEMTPIKAPLFDNYRRAGDEIQYKGKTENKYIELGEPRQPRRPETPNIYVPVLKIPSSVQNTAFKSPKVEKKNGDKDEEDDLKMLEEFAKVSPNNIAAKDINLLNASGFSGVNKIMKKKKEKDTFSVSSATSVKLNSVLIADPDVSSLKPVKKKKNPFVVFNKIKEWGTDNADQIDFKTGDDLKTLEFVDKQLHDMFQMDQETAEKWAKRYKKEDVEKFCKLWGVENLFKGKVKRQLLPRERFANIRLLMENGYLTTFIEGIYVEGLNYGTRIPTNEVKNFGEIAFPMDASYGLGDPSVQYFAFEKFDGTLVSAEKGNVARDTFDSLYSYLDSMKLSPIGPTAIDGTYMFWRWQGSIYIHPEFIQCAVPGFFKPDVGSIVWSEPAVSVTNLPDTWAFARKFMDAFNKAMDAGKTSGVGIKRLANLAEKGTICFTHFDTKMFDILGLDHSKYEAADVQWGLFFSGSKLYSPSIPITSVAFWDQQTSPYETLQRGRNTIKTSPSSSKPLHVCKPENYFFNYPYDKMMGSDPWGK